MKTNKNTIIYDTVEKRIVNEFLKLLQSVGYKQITVSQLIINSQINRSTFYAHFFAQKSINWTIFIQLIKQHLRYDYYYKN